MVYEGRTPQKKSNWKRWPAHPRVEPIPSWDKAACVHLGRVGTHAGACVRQGHGGFGDRLGPAGVRNHSTGALAKQFGETAISFTEFVRTRSLRTPVGMAPLGPRHSAFAQHFLRPHREMGILASMALLLAGGGDLLLVGASQQGIFAANDCQPESKEWRHCRRI